MCRLITQIHFFLLEIETTTSLENPLLTINHALTAMTIKYQNTKLCNTNCISATTYVKSLLVKAILYNPHLQGFNNVLICILDIAPTKVGNFPSKATIIIYCYNQILSLQHKNRWISWSKAEQSKKWTGLWKEL